LVYFPPFGLLHHEKSGNPDQEWSYDSFKALQQSGFGSMSKKRSLDKVFFAFVAEGARTSDHIRLCSIFFHANFNPRALHIKNSLLGKALCFPKQNTQTVQIK
jgi:hypothetical protein